ncbi:GNAT family N-acetyltransferase [Aestuariivita boseongensis]|uniref:GNAT family N-acetyltransferase n=1 Tax=Aestuariivita boseongensis TaxID=1470562 RepID=UPI0009E33D1B|nr:GNAT family N-acetyltransferase [Aestuariivita boseongensis]
MQKPITTERLTLRRLAAEDWQQFNMYAGSDRSIPSGGPYSEGKAWRTFAMWIGHWEIRGYGLLACDLRVRPNKVIGIAGPFFPPDAPEPEIGWQIWDPEFEGKGYAYEAAEAARRWACESLGLQRPVSYIKEGNERSIRLAKKLGCVRDERARRRPDGLPVWRHPPLDGILS